MNFEGNILNFQELLLKRSYEFFKSLYLDQNQNNIEEFFNVIGEDILKVILEIQSKGRICGSTNAIFIALIPKSSDPSSFNDFRPISLCNVIYKINSKIIANRLKIVLAEGITKNQFVFHLGRQILNAIGTS